MICCLVTIVQLPIVRSKRSGWNRNQNCGEITGLTVRLDVYASRDASPVLRRELCAHTLKAAKSADEGIDVVVVVVKSK